MANRKIDQKRLALIFYALSLSIGSIVTVYIAINLLSGSNDLRPFVINDLLPNRDALLFVFSFPVLFLIATVLSGRLTRLPSYDDINRLVVVNIALYIAFGTILAFARILLLSRTILLLEFIFTTAMLFMMFFVRRKYFPPRLGLIPTVDIKRYLKFKTIDWITLEDNCGQVEGLDGAVVNFHNLPRRREDSFVAEFLRKGIPLFDDNELLESLSGRISLDDLTDIEVEDLRPKAVYLQIKRLIDVFLVALAAPIILPTCMVAAAIIKIDSPGPVFFIQERIGYRGRKFRLYKFRSMVGGSENEGSKFAELEDRRITRVGRTLRRVRLDELPQLWNVLKGEMSIVGPRPEQIVFVERFNKMIPFYSFRHAVRPGITGWAQVMYGYASSDKQTIEKLAYDFFYIKHVSLWLELVIVFKTVRTIMIGFGAR